MFKTYSNQAVKLIGQESTPGEPQFSRHLSKELDLVDGETRKRLKKAKNVEEIHQILDSPNTKWATRARCLRHPLVPEGCKLPDEIDIESQLKRFYRGSKLVTRS